MRISDWRSDVCSSDLERPIVTNVIAGSPAATAGLVPGDEITSFNGSRIIMAADVRQHIMIQPNKAVEIEILRGNAARKLTATLSEQTVQDDIGNSAKIGLLGRSEERRVGQEGGSPCRSRWRPAH